MIKTLLTAAIIGLSLLSPTFAQTPTECVTPDKFLELTDSNHVVASYTLLPIQKFNPTDKRPDKVGVFLHINGEDVMILHFDKNSCLILDPPVYTTLSDLRAKYGYTFADKESNN